MESDDNSIRNDQLAVRSRWLSISAVLYVVVYASLIGLVCIIPDRFILTLLIVGNTWAMMTYAFPVIVLGLLLTELSWALAGKTAFDAKSMAIALLLIVACMAWAFLIALPSLNTF